MKILDAHLNDLLLFVLWWLAAASLTMIKRKVLQFRHQLCSITKHLKLQTLYVELPAFVFLYFSLLIMNYFS